MALSRRPERTNRAPMAYAPLGFVVTNCSAASRLAMQDRVQAEPQVVRPREAQLVESQRRVGLLAARQVEPPVALRAVEHRPVARWMDGTRQVLVSDEHEIFKVRNADRYKELPLLFGKGAPARASEVLRLIAAEPELARHVTGARLVGERRWDIYLDGRIEVRLPGSRPEAAWRRLCSMPLCRPCWACSSRRCWSAW